MTDQVPTDTAVETKTTALHALHVELGGRLVEFAGWELPIQYEGVIAEHTACRERAALFDVSHMGVVELRSPDGIDALANALESLTPASIATIGEGRQRYALLTNDRGGVIDDCIVTNRGDHLMVVVNAARRDVDLARLRTGLDGIDVVQRTDVSLLALQGPQAATALTRLCPAVQELVFLDFRQLDVELGTADTAAAGSRIEGVGVSRSGYTGEDGFELLVASERAEALARGLLAQPEVTPAGLGARDTLRLEAGLPLYGHDLDETTSPVEADLVWTMPKRRREDGRFPGADRILAEYAEGPARARVGLRPRGRRPVRDQTPLRTPSGEPAGVVTSGGYGPTVGGPVAMGYVPTELATDGQTLLADVRGSDVEIDVVALPFTPHRYHRGT
ncbi:MAG: glycine cleavage system aminomethyltransferase GcvT [Acidimicrobiia bacterium]|nr:glycine cleavage system aminomethyltransferase GcvT [Acidimicrobiia bacterium]